LTRICVLWAEGVVCMPNALWNGTHCYCKSANWASNTPADVVVNGACCSENSYFDWKGFQGDGLCTCNPGTWWNQTHCLPILPAVLPHGVQGPCLFFLQKFIVWGNQGPIICSMRAAERTWTGAICIRTLCHCYECQADTEKLRRY
jgi:hypothetical protein